MNRKLPILLICVVIVGAVVFHLVSTGKLGGPSDKTQVESLAETLISAIMQGDEGSLQQVLHEDFVFDAMDLLVGRREFVRDVVAGDLWAKVSDNRELEIAGTTGHLTAPFEANIKIENQFLEFLGSMRVDFLKEGQVWSVRSIRIMPGPYH